ncbi:hypothetical protein [Pseudomonas aegrilactucae]|uniref:Uncharacterized protein n=1 Tax=Pseudomonas aegrilactucae TaxID=2854028 RepID=A0A9Q2XPF1_9PSED|nr:hypothetical protein [Pseudomonas aegrilactucae]MBV6290020.1 hypothetical protein [Pseudomonas aegrilactucae]
MQMNMGRPFKHQAMARELAGQAVQDNQAAFSQMERNWNIARASQDITVALAARGGLLEWLAATAILGHEADFESGAKTLIQWGCKLAEAFRPAPELLLVELSLAIRRKDHAARRQLASAILKSAPSDDFYNLERGQSQALAALVDLDYDTAQRHALRLQDAAASGEFDKGDSILAGAWAKVMHNLAQQDFRGCVNALLLSHKEFARQVDLELGRLQRGADSDITMFDMVDWTADAVAQLVVDFGYKLDHLNKRDSQEYGF